MPARTLPDATLSPVPDQIRQPIPRGRALQTAVLGWAFLGIALGGSIGISETLSRVFGWGRLAEVLLQAVLMSAVVVPGIVLLRRRLDRRRLEGLGLSSSAARPLALGAAVGALTGLLVWVSTLVGGMLLRAATGQGTATAFILVATGFLGVTLIGWRLLARVVRRSDSRVA